MAQELLSSDPAAGQLLSSDPSAGLPVFRQQDQTPNDVDPNTVGTLLSHLAAQVNPLAAVKAIGNALPLPKALGGQGWDAPIQTVKAIGAAQGALYDKAVRSYKDGDYVTAARHFVDYLIPLAGPALDKSSDLFQAGKWAAGGGDALGLGLAMFGPTAIARAMAPRPQLTPAAAPEPSAVEDALNTTANRQVVDVIAPKVGPNKMRFGKLAADVAPTIARDTTGLTRSAVAESITNKLDAAAEALDTVAAQRSTAPTPTAPLLQALQAKKAALIVTAQPGGANVIPAPLIVTAQPGGANVIPAPSATRVAPIDQAIKEVTQLGPTATYDALRKIRQAYDEPARAVYNSAITPDYMKSMGDKLGAADVTAAFRDHLATLSPETAAANATYSLWKKAADVVQAAEEIDRVRPTVGRSIMARGLGAAVGAGAGGSLGAAVGAIVGPAVERLMASASPAVKMASARMLTSIADALHANDWSRAVTLTHALQRALPAAKAVDAGQTMTMLPVAAQSRATPAQTGPVTR